jgi:hypothetical protein
MPLVDVAGGICQALSHDPGCRARGGRAGAHDAGVPVVAGWARQMFYFVIASSSDTM